MSSKNYIGQLDTRVKVIESILTPSTSGGPVSTDNELQEIWAKVEDAGGDEEIDGKIIALNVRRYIIQHNPVIVKKKITELFIDDAGERYNIHGSINVGRKEFIVLKCSKRE